MAQPTLTPVTLNGVDVGGGIDMAVDVIDGQAWSPILVGYSTGDGSANVVMVDTGLPVVAATGATWASTQSGVWNITNISGTVSLPTGAATEATLNSALTSLQLIDNAVSGAGYNITQFAGAAVPIGAGTEAAALRVTLATDSTGVLSVDDNGGSLTVDGTFFQGTQPVSGTFWQATQPVSNGGTFVVQEDGAALTALQLIDDTVVTLGTATYSEATTSGNVMGVVRNDVLAPLADTDNEIAPLQVDAKGALWITPSPNVVDDGNSRTTNLAGGATFTGTSVDTLGFAGITINLFSDQDGATDGMRFEFSSDNSAWTTSHRHDYTANNDREFQFTTLAQFFRVVFINGATPTGTIRIQTILHRQTVPSTTIHRLDDSLAPDRSAQVVKASLMAQAAGSGNFVPINSTAAGNLKVAVEEFDSSLPSGTDTIGGTISQQSTSIAYDGTTAATIKRFSVVATADDATIIAAPSGTKKIRVLSMTIIALSATATTIHLQTKTSNTDVFATAANPLPIAVDADGNDHGGVVMGWNQGGWLETAEADEILAVKMPGGAQPLLFIGNYIEVS